MTTLTPTSHNNNILTPNDLQKKLAFPKNTNQVIGKCTTWKKGQRVYARDPLVVWARGTVIDVLDGHLLVQTRTQTCSVPLKEAVLQPTEEDFVFVPDLTSISPLSAPAVLECLWRRYERADVYTWAGQTLVALNPFEHLPHLYGVDTISAYHAIHKDVNNKGAPHVYGVAARAHSNMRCQGFQPNQSIIVSGESGAGKTVSARHLMKYLVTVANHSPIGEDSFGCEIERRILNSNPILEAFGNAGTLRNGNSSRFGKYIEIQFDSFGHVSGATVQTYLLEKTRVVQQLSGEYTFHIFYQMLAGLPREKKQRLGLREDLLNVTSRVADEDVRHWRETQEALTSLQVTDQLKDQLEQILSAILLLNHTTISEDEEDEDISCITNTPENMAVAEKAAELLQVDLGALETTLTHRRITAAHARRKSVFSKPCCAAEAAGRRDCLSKLLYNQLFEWLVEVINGSIHTEDVHTTIGLLDIYGFESFRVNSLEQLCINYANERLQQHYVAHFLRDQQDAYLEEAVPWSDVTYADNRPCLQLLEGLQGGPPGLFSLINEECQVARPGGDRGLCDRLLGALGAGPGTVKPGSSPPGKLGAPRQTRETTPGFVVNHYAAPVTYHAPGLLDKNKDNIPPELLELLRSSSNSFVTELVTKFEPDHPGKKKKTVLAKFKSSLDQLMQALGQTQPHYIRCVKPSPSSSPRDLDPVYVHEQLAASGIYETVEVNKRGYPTRIPYEKFLQQYSMVLRCMPDEGPRLPSNQQANKENELLFDPLDMLYQKQLRLTPRRQSATPKRKLRRRAGLSSCDHTRKLTASILCSAFGRHFSKNPTAFCQFGITKLFLRDGKLEQLEALRLRLASVHVFTIQCAWRRHQRHQRQRRHQAATRLQAAWRGYKQQCRYRRVMSAALTLQRALRSWCARRTEQRSLRAAATPSRSSPGDEQLGEEFFTPRERRGRVPDTGLHGAGPCFTPAGNNQLSPRGDHQTLTAGDCTPTDGSLLPTNLQTPTNQRLPPAEEDGVLLYSSPRSLNGPLPPIALPTLQPYGTGAAILQPPTATSGSAASLWDAEEADAYVVCEEDGEDGGKVYHIVRSPRPGASRERARQVLHRVAASISATCLSRWRFNMAGTFTGIPYLEAQSGVLSRRRMPRVQIKFHTRANPLLQGAHHISHQEFQCSLSDCLS